MADSRRDLIVQAIRTELARQSAGHAPGEPGGVDADSLAEAIDQALGGPVSKDEGLRPDQLSSENDR